MYKNYAQIIGNLTRDVELKKLPNGSSVATFSIATNRRWKDGNGQKQEEVEYHNIVCFGKQAETIAQYVKKGDQLLVEGRLKTRTWDDEGTGKKMYRTEIVMESFVFGNNKKQADNNNGYDIGADYSQPGTESTTVSYPTEDIDPSDIPF